MYVRFSFFLFLIFIYLFGCSGRSSLGFPGCAGGKEPACQCRRYKRCKFDPWVRKIPGVHRVAQSCNRSDLGGTQAGFSCGMQTLS